MTDVLKTDLSETSNDFITDYVDKSEPMENPPDPSNKLFPFEFLPVNNKLLKIPRIPQIFDILDEYFTIIEREFDPINKVTIRTDIKVMISDQRYIYVPIPFAESIANLLTNNGFLFDKNSIPKLDPQDIFDIDESWYDFFRPEQLDYLEAIVRNPRGVVQLPTGFGKTEFIMALAQAYKGSGNVLILVPNNGVREEIQYRSNEKKIDIGVGIVPSKKICVINPVGFMNSHAIYDENNIKWINGVDLILMDESDNINNSLAKLLENYATSYKYILGFSATPDKYDGKLLRTKDLRKFTLAPFLVMKYIGPSIIYAKCTKTVNFTEFTGHYDAKRCPPNLPHLAYNISLKNIIFSSTFLNKELKYMMKHKNKILFIPVPNWKHAEKIYYHLQAIGYQAVAWRAGYVMSTITGITTYTDLKNHCALQDSEGFSGQKIDCIICTSVGFIGINIPQITDVYLYIGTQVKTILQPAGRAFRGDHIPTIWLSSESRNGVNDFFKRCTWRRERIIRQAYNVNFKSISNLELNNEGDFINQGNIGTI